MGAPDTIKRLVDTFQRNVEVYKNDSINETQLRREFLDSFFTALGWDVENKAGYADAYKDVIHEYSLKTKDVREAPDYCFRIGGTRKFFVEAKKPSVNVKDDIHPAFQLRSYAWSAKLPLSLLTDFEEFAVYDCRIPPNKKDKASNARILFLTYDQYIDKWDEIENIFARESILKGSFDKYVESNKKKKGTAEVDLVFLDQMEVWRKALAKNIALRNPHLSIRELNYSVQKTIDRIIFLRICEDRGIEDYGQLMSLQNGNSVYERLKQIFQRADEKYNSGLFHFENERDRIEPPDNLTLDLSVDDKTIKDIVKELYYPESPYEFSVLPADILGQVYEQFLGKVIRLTAGHQAVIEDKPEVKKAGGVYYTPTYIVDYIVNNTVGRLLEKFALPKEVSKIKVLDPACGSGSFLLGAYQYLLDWHLKYYLKELETSNTLLKQKHQPIYINDRGVYLLTTSEKKRILLNNIYGVDIDSQAVEVTKLSLMLKVLEGESTQTLSNELQFFRERALPDLSNNIKCGNSLIGPDFYNQTEMNFLDDEEKMRINVFDWNTEFKDIMNAGGFDVVIGNPPYIQSRDGQLENIERNYYYKNYRTTENQINTYGLFIEKGIALLKLNGLCGLIVPNYWLSTKYDYELRKFLFIENTTTEILNTYKVFKYAVVDTLLLFSIKKLNNQNRLLLRSLSRNLKTIDDRLNDLKNAKWGFEKNIIIHTPDIEIAFSDTVELRGDKIIEDYFDLKFGVKLYQVGKGKPPQSKKESNDRVFESVQKKDTDYFILLRARNVQRFNIIKEDYYIKYGKHLAEPRDISLFQGSRLLLQRIISKELLDITFAEETMVCNTDVITLKPKKINAHLKVFLGILSSKLCTKYLRSKNINLDRDVYPKINTKTLSTFIVPDISKIDIAQINNLEKLVEQNLLLHKKISTIQTPTERTSIERQIQVTDAQIDQLVYQLYGLTEEEIKIVEQK